MSQGLALESGEFIPAEELNKMMNAKSKCAQCGKGYSPTTGAVGCPKCAPGVKVDEVEFRQPLGAQQPAPSAAAVDEGFLRSVIMLCNNQGASPESIENFDSGDKWIADLWRQADQLIATAPQADSRPAAVPRWDEMIRQQFPDMLPKEWSDTLIRRYMTRELDALRAARAPVDSVTAPAGGGAPVATLHCNDIGYVWARVTDSGKLLRFEEPMNLYTTPPAQAADSVLEDAETALRKVLGVVQRYLPPDGPSAHDSLSEIIEIVDPWPLGQLEKP